MQKPRGMDNSRCLAIQPSSPLNAHPKKNTRSDDAQGKKYLSGLLDEFDRKVEDGEIKTSASVSVHLGLADDMQE